MTINTVTSSPITDGPYACRNAGSKIGLLISSELLLFARPTSPMSEPGRRDQGRFSSPAPPSLVTSSISERGFSITSVAQYLSSPAQRTMWHPSTCTVGPCPRGFDPEKEPVGVRTRCDMRCVLNQTWYHLESRCTRRRSQSEERDVFKKEDTLITPNHRFKLEPPMSLNKVLMIPDVARAYEDASQNTGKSACARTRSPAI
eukprot:3347788-Pleurochrysis_carterae.AAC.2